MNMKEIKAIIQPGKLEKLREKLIALPEFPGMSVGRAEGCSPTATIHPRDLREQLTDFSPKVRIEILADETQVEAILEIIYAVCHTGHVGDGVVWVTPTEHFHRLRLPRK